MHDSGFLLSVLYLFGQLIAVLLPTGIGLFLARISRAT
jgi:hypothetical protein